MSRYYSRPVGRFTDDGFVFDGYEIVRKDTLEVVATAGNEARARLLVIRYNREAASGEAAEA